MFGLFFKNKSIFWRAAKINAPCTSVAFGERYKLGNSRKSYKDFIKIFISAFAVVGPIASSGLIEQYNQAIRVTEQ